MARKSFAGWVEEHPALFWLGIIALFVAALAGLAVLQPASDDVTAVIFLGLGAGVTGAAMHEHYTKVLIETIRERDAYWRSREEDLASGSRSSPSRSGVAPPAN